MDTNAPITKKTKSAIGKFSDVISNFLGSWAAVIFHILWFGIWLVFNYDINILTFSVSLEAIFIGIFLLMASNKAEVVRDKKEERLRKNDRQRIEKDIKLDERANRQLVEIKKIQKDLEIKVKTIIKEIKKLQN